MLQIACLRKQRLVKFLLITAFYICLTGFSTSIEEIGLVDVNFFISQVSQESNSNVALLKQTVEQSLNLPASFQVEFPTIVTIDENYAMVEWLSGHVGGLVFLRQTNSTWSIIPGTGGGVPDTEHLVSVGIPRNVAQGFMDYLNNPNK